MSEEQKQLLEQKLWDIANTLRGKIDADAYRDYILGFIFYKYLSEKLYLKANSLLKGEKVEDYYLVDDEETLEAIREEVLESLGYFLEPEELFDFIVVRGQKVNNATTAIRGYANILTRLNRNIKALGSVKTKVDGKDFEIELIDRPSSHIIEDLEAVLRKIEQSTMGTESQDDFDALFEDIELASTKLGKTPDKRNEIVVDIITKLSEIDFKLEDINSDVLGDAYEYLIAKFASTAGKSAGEFYTPQQVSKILAKIVTDKKQRLKNVYDPTAGSGSLLLRVAKETAVTEFFGQEMNRTTFNLARMNMLLHDVHYSRFDIENDDTLEEPRHLNQKFEAIVANPPFSANWKADNNPLNNTDERFSQFGKLAPKTKADFAFLQHMYYQLSDNGTLASVFPHGILFRGSSEGHIRKYFIEKLNAIDAIIGLPANLFYGTPIPACIIILKKCRKFDDNIVFIDASSEGNYKKVGNQNELRDNDVEKIVKAYFNREPIEKYCSIVSKAEIKENEYNLNIRRYVDSYIEEDEVDFTHLQSKVKEHKERLEKNEKILNMLCDELEITTPDSNNFDYLLNFKKGLMQKLFSKGIRFKNDSGSSFREWENKTLSEIGNTFNGLTGKSGEDFGQGEPYIQYKQIFDNSKIDPSKFGQVKVGFNENQNRAQYGDVFFTVSSETPHEVGTASVLLDEIDNLYLNSFSFGFRVKSFELYNPNFLRFFFRSATFRREIIKLAQGSTRYNMSKISFLKLQFSFPEIREQNKIAAVLTAMENKIDFISKKI